MNDTMAGMMPLMVFHFSSRVPGGLLFSGWRVSSVSGEGCVCAVECGLGHLWFRSTCCYALQQAKSIISFDDIQNFKGNIFFTLLEARNYSKQMIHHHWHRR